MEEREIIAKLKEFREISPRADWKEATKAYITGQTIGAPKKEFSGGFLFSFKPAKFILQPAMIMPLIIIVLIGVGIFAHFYLGSSEKVVETPYQRPAATYLVLAETKLSELKNPEDVKEVAQMLEKAANSMSEVPKDPAETAKVVESLVNINKKVKELDEETEGMEELKTKTEILTTKVSEVLEENINDTSAGLAENLIKMFKTRSLAECGKELLAGAEADYNDGNYNDVLIKIDMIEKCQQE